MSDKTSLLSAAFSQHQCDNMVICSSLVNESTFRRKYHRSSKLSVLQHERQQAFTAHHSRQKQTGKQALPIAAIEEREGKCAG